MKALNPEIINEVKLFTDAFLLGAFFTFVYDGIRMLRRIFPRGVFWVSVEDFVFWFMACGGMFALLYSRNNGAMRFYIFLATFLGGICYYLLIGRHFMPIFTHIVVGIKKQLKKIVGKVTMGWKKRSRK